MIELALNNVCKYYGANKVFDNITFEVQTGERLALIGRNGTGKTTIFKIIAGIEEIEKHDGGVLSIRKDATIGYLDQIPSYPETYKVPDVVNSIVFTFSLKALSSNVSSSICAILIFL